MMSHSTDDSYRVPAPGEAADPVYTPEEREVMALPRKVPTTKTKRKESSQQRWALFNGFVDYGMAALKPSDAAVWMVLFRYAKADGSVFASLKTLATLTGVNRRTVQHAVEHLEAAGHIVKVQRGGGCVATRYNLVKVNKGGRQNVPE